MGPLTPVSTGQRWQPTAEEINLFKAAAERNLVPGARPRTADVSALGRTLDITARNSTGEILGLFGVATIKEALITPADNLEEFKQTAAIDAESPVPGDRAVIFVNGANQDDIVSAAIVGFTPALVEIVTESDTACDVIEDETTKLKSGSGPIEIVWKPSGTGDKWCLVLMGGGATAPEILLKGTVTTTVGTSDATFALTPAVAYGGAPLPSGNVVVLNSPAEARTTGTTLIVRKRTTPVDVSGSDVFWEPWEASEGGEDEIILCHYVDHFYSSGNSTTVRPLNAAGTQPLATEQSLAVDVLDFIARDTNKQFYGLPDERVWVMRHGNVNEIVEHEQYPTWIEATKLADDSAAVGAVQIEGELGLPSVVDMFDATNSIEQLPEGSRLWLRFAYCNSQDNPTYCLTNTHDQRLGVAKLTSDLEATDATKPAQYIRSVQGPNPTNNPTLFDNPHGLEAVKDSIILVSEKTDGNWVIAMANKTKICAGHGIRIADSLADPVDIGCFMLDIHPDACLDVVDDKLIDTRVFTGDVEETGCTVNIPPYTAGACIDISNRVVSVEVDSSDSNQLGCNAGGLYVPPPPEPTSGSSYITIINNQIDIDFDQLRDDICDSTECGGGGFDPATDDWDVECTLTAGGLEIKVTIDGVEKSCTVDVEPTICN